jgi:capsular exopolysaccharide synthesis family protein
MVQLRARQADLMARVADYSGRYNETHPALRTARAELADIDRQIQAEVARHAQGLRNEADIARARLGSLQSHLSQVRNALIGSNAQQVRLRELERNAAAARTVYEAFLTRYHLVADGSGRGGDAQIVSEAMEPTAPVSRPWLSFAILAALLGFLAGVLAALIVEQLDTRVQSAEDIEEKTGAEMLTSIPALTRAELSRLSAPDRHPAGYVAAKPLSAFAEAIRVLRVRILHAGWSAKKVVAVTSALPGEGKTSVALCLARVCALSGQRVVLVDCDLRRRSLNHLLGVDPEKGLVQVLRGEIPWQAAVGVDEASGAHILPAAQEMYTIEDVCGSTAMKQLLETLAREHDMVILDCAPVLTLADVRDLASVADGVVMVARRGRTEAAALQTAISELKAVRASVLGVALNGVDLRAPGRYSYGDPLYFSHATAGMYTL